MTPADVERNRIAVEGVLYRRSFRAFIPEAFEVVEQGDQTAESVRLGLAKARYAHGWHVDAIADHLQAVAEGSMRRLLINVPPGTSKSMLTSVLWPAWLWARDPTIRTLFSSYSEEFTKRDIRKSKRLMRGEWFTNHFPSTRLVAVPDTMMEVHTTMGGERQGASTNSGVTGKHVHGIVEDDPLKMQDASSKRARDEAWDYRTQALGFRLLPEAGWRVLVMQRLHEDDPSGRILEAQKHMLEEQDGEKYEHLMLPMEFEPGRRCKTRIFMDPRTYDGELLWPERMDAKFVAEKKGPLGLGAYGYAGQAQQRPAPIEGGVIRRDWWKFWNELPADLEEIVTSWDLTFKDGEKTDFFVGQCWGRKGANKYLIAQVRARGGFTDQLTAFKLFAQRFPKARAHYVEEAANGAALIDTLKKHIAGIIAVKPLGSKIARAEAIAPQAEAGNLYLPEHEQWVGEYVEEWCSLPNGAHDDQVDATSQAVAKLSKRKLYDMEAISMTKSSVWR